MLFNVSGLIREGIGATRVHEVEGTLLTEGRAPERVSGRVELLRTKSGVLVRASLQVLESGVCSRCLKPLLQALPIEFEEEFQSTVDLRTGEPVAQAPDTDAFLIDDRHLLDLTEAVRQYREAAEPMQPLCRPECRGLCPHCGADLNLGDCPCGGESVDPRWQRLAALSKAAQKEKE